eukprot:COSAG03_NODE_70_length_14773_cov_16.054711_9_plen_101_part_00
MRVAFVYHQQLVGHSLLPPQQYGNRTVLVFCIEMAECHLSRPVRAPGVIFALYYVLGVIFRTTYWPSVIFRRVHDPGVIFRYSATPGVIFGQKGTLCDNF